MVICDFIAGSLGGMFGVFAGHPFDTVKINQQIQNKGLVTTTKTIYTHSGVRGFFRGVAFPVVSYGAVNSMFFGVYAHTLEFFIKSGKCALDPIAVEIDQIESDDPSFEMTPVPVLEIEVEEQRIERFHASSGSVFTAGCIAGVTQLWLTCPIEMLKVRQQIETSKVALFPYTRDLIRTHGFKILYRGIFPMALREGPSSGLYMLIYHLGNKLTHGFSDTHDDFVHYAGLFASGGTSGVLSWWCILPIDVVKSKIQTDDLKNPKYKGAWDCAKQIWKSQGIGGFYRGFVPVSMRAFPINGLTFLTYEMFLQLCNHYTKK